MIIPKKERLAVYSELFKEGVMVAKKNTRGINHHILTDIQNLYVLEMMKSLKSRGYIKENFSWRWYYWYVALIFTIYVNTCIYHSISVDIYSCIHFERKIFLFDCYECISMSICYSLLFIIIGF